LPQLNKLSKYKKKSIPKSIKINIWNTYIGEDIMKHKCFCCKKNTIKIIDFEAGHVLSESNGGTDEITNFRPICRSCNSSMGTMHMEEYVKKYGLYI
jgi:5-methylcytosine-specific restriction endonuclease McrA